MGGFLARDARNISSICNRLKCVTHWHEMRHILNRNAAHIVEKCAAFLVNVRPLLNDVCHITEQCVPHFTWLHKEVMLLT